MTDTPATHYEEDAADYDPAPRTVVIIPDSRSSEILMGETVSMLIEANSIEQGVVELSTLVGVTAAAAFKEAQVPYKVLSFGQGTPDFAAERPYNPKTSTTLEDASYLFKHSDGVVEVDADSLHTLDANYIFVPAIAGSGQQRIDLAVESAPVDVGETTLIGHLLALFEQTGETDVLLIDPPERGLIQNADGSYHRRLMKLDFSSPISADAGRL